MRRKVIMSGYVVVWGIGGRTKVKEYNNRWEAFYQFKDLCADPDVVAVQMQKPNGYVLHEYKRKDLRS